MIMAKKETVNICIIKGNEGGLKESYPITPNTPPPPKTK